MHSHRGQNSGKQTCNRILRQWSHGLRGPQTVNSGCCNSPTLNGLPTHSKLRYRCGHSMGVVKGKRICRCTVVISLWNRYWSVGAGCKFPPLPAAFLNNVQTLPPDAAFYLYHRLATSTHAKINSVVKHYQEFRIPLSLPDFPVTQTSIVAFISYIAPTK